MSCLTSVLPGIRDTGSGNSAYISGLVMMDVMMRFFKLDLFVVATGTVRFIFRFFYSVICVGLIGALRRW